MNLTENKIRGRWQMWSKEFDGMKTAEKIDRGIVAVINPLTLLRRKKFKEENRDTWIEEMMKKDENVKAFYVNTLYVQETIKALNNNKYSENDIEKLIQEHKQSLVKLKYIS
jgi:hypothetical protein